MDLAEKIALHGKFYEELGLFTPDDFEDFETEITSISKLPVKSELQ